MTRSLLLRLVLFVSGGLFCLAGFALLMPDAWLKSAVGWFADAKTLEANWPDSPLFAYLLRTSFVAYLWIGSVLLVSAVNPTRYRTQIDIAIGGLFLMAVVCVVTGFTRDVPTLWFLGDAISCAVIAVLLVALRSRPS